MACPLLRPVTIFSTLLLPFSLPSQLSFCLFCSFRTIRVRTSSLPPHSYEPLRQKKDICVPHMSCFSAALHFASFQHSLTFLLCDAYHVACLVLAFVRYWNAKKGDEEKGEGREGREGGAVCRGCGRRYAETHSLF